MVISRMDQISKTALLLASVKLNIMESLLQKQIEDEEERQHELSCYKTLWGCEWLFEHTRELRAAMVMKLASERRQQAEARRAQMLEAKRQATTIKSLTKAARFEQGKQNKFPNARR